MHDIIKREISAGKSPMAVAGSVIYLSAMNTGKNPNISHEKQECQLTYAENST
jgi:hypothetical protein